MIMNQGEVNLLRYYVKVWRPARVWAEDLLCETLKIHVAADLLQQSDGLPRSVPGTSWVYRTLHRDVHVYSNDGPLGISFGVDSLEPTVAQLEDFIRKEIVAEREADIDTYMRMFEAIDFRDMADAAIATVPRHKTMLEHRTEMRRALHSEQPERALIEIFER